MVSINPEVGEPQFAPKPSSPDFIDLEGLKLGRLHVVGFVGHNRWWCTCTCGAAFVRRGWSLRRAHNEGSEASCGCRKNPGNSAFTIHNRCRTPEWRSWAKMHERCFDQNYHAYPRYGGRGITVCDRWRIGEAGQHGFECFFEDLGQKPTRKHSLDRKDNNGNYEPSNCRWATRREQNRNKCNSIFLEINGERLHIADWAERCGLRRATLLRRIRKGWEVGRALQPPCRGRVPNCKSRGGKRHG